MRKLFEQLNQRLSGFLDQSDHSMLVVTCTQSDTALILKTLQPMEDQKSSCFFWTLADEFNSASSFAQTLYERFEYKHQQMCQGLEKEGLPPWPAIPDALKKTTQSPVARTRHVMTFARSLIPQPPGIVHAWVLFPLTINDPKGYADFVGELLRNDSPIPWCHHLRFMIRDDKEAASLPTTLEHTPRVDWYSPDLSQQAMTQSLEDEVNDEDVALDQRLQSLLVLAGMDYSHKRYEDALSKYHLLLRYYRATQNRALEALVLNGIGEVHDRQGQPQQAQQHYEAALDPAIESESTPVLLNVSLNLANQALAQEQWEDAERYYDGAENMATAQMFAEVKIQCMENRGYCQFQQGRINQAKQTWETAAVLAENVQEPELQKSVLQRMHDQFKQYVKQYDDPVIEVCVKQVQQQLATIT